jgi:acylphosphatase
MRVVVSGMVQGVGFRYSASKEARRRGLVGWVRNLDSGEVEAWIEGPRAEVEAFAEWLKDGPPGSIVRHATITRESPRGAYRDFSIAF